MGGIICSSLTLKNLSCSVFSSTLRIKAKCLLNYPYNKQSRYLLHISSSAKRAYSIWYGSTWLPHSLQDMCMFDFVWRQFGLNMLSRTHYTYIYSISANPHVCARKLVSEASHDLWRCVPESCTKERTRIVENRCHCITPATWEVRTVDYKSTVIFCRKSGYLYTDTYSWRAEASIIH